MGKKTEKEELLHPCFDALSKSDLEQLWENATILTFEKDEPIIKLNSFTTHIYYLIEGMAKVDIGIEKKNNTIRIVPSQRFIGTVYSLHDSQYKMSAKALMPSKILLINAATLKQIIRSNGNFAISLLEATTRTAANTIERLLTYYNKTIDGSLAAFLLQFSNISQENAFNIPFSRKEIAEIIGYSRENVTHTFTRFSKEGLIEQSGKTIKLLDIPRLKSIVQNG
ncbi:MAG: Crp/Fnr family transcriptional regulator [Bacteroidota bacterium]